jgi:hypothetical protein
MLDSLHKVGGFASRVFKSVNATRVRASVPAVAGMVALSAGIGGIVQTFAGTGGFYCGLVVAGIFCLRIDSRL